MFLNQANLLFCEANLISYMHFISPFLLLYIFFYHFLSFLSPSLHLYLSLSLFLTVFSSRYVGGLLVRQSTRECIFFAPSSSNSLSLPTALCQRMKEIESAGISEHCHWSTSVTWHGKLTCDWLVRSRDRRCSLLIGRRSRGSPANNCSKLVPSIAG